MRHAIFALAFVGLATLAQAQTASVTLGWEQNVEPDVEMYVVQVGTQSKGPYHDAAVVDRAEAPPSAVVRLAVGSTYYFIVRAVNVLGLMSPKSDEVSVALSGQPADDCTPVTGRYAVYVFPTATQRTGGGGAGSKARFDFQVASPNSPIVKVTVQMNALVVQSMTGFDLGALAGMWFTLPASGTYTLSATAMNAQGCSRTGTYVQQVVVP